MKPDTRHGCGGVVGELHTHIERCSPTGASRFESGPQPTHLIQEPQAGSLSARGARVAPLYPAHACPDCGKRTWSPWGRCHPCEMANARRLVNRLAELRS